MNTNTVTGCHTLEIIPLTSLSRFARVGCRAVIQILGYSYKAKEIPGSLMVSTTTENGVIKKKITFDCSGVNIFETNRLDVFRSSRVIATYFDENGNRRVAGSPSYPLKLDYTISDGAYSCVLEGEDTDTDAFL